MYQLLHTRIRVSDLDRSIRFYEDTSVSSSSAAPTARPTATRSSTWNCRATSTPSNSPVADYELNVPEDLMHFAIGVPDLIAFCDELEGKGLEIWPDDWRETFPTGRKMAFIDDPDGYEIELLER